MHFREHPTCWTNILARKMSITVKFERLNCLFEPGAMNFQISLKYYKSILFISLNPSVSSNCHFRTMFVKQPSSSLIFNQLLVIPCLLVSSPSSESSNSTITKALKICLSAMIASEEKLSKATESLAISEVITMSLHFLNVGPTCWTHRCK